MKLQAPSSKLQRNFKLQAPTSRLQKSWMLELGIWCFSGAWSLVLGASLLVTGVSGLAALSGSTNSPLSAWLGSQTNIQSWSADFVQTRALKSLTQPLTATG